MAAANGVVVWNALVGWFVTAAAGCHRRQCTIPPLSPCQPCFHRWLGVRRPRVGVSVGVGVSALGTARRNCDERFQNEKESEKETPAETYANRDDVTVPRTNNQYLVEEWITALWWSLKLDVSHSLCSKELKRALFAEDTDVYTDIDIDIDAYTNTGIDIASGIDPSWIVKGIPEKPLYKEVAKRLFEWNQRCFCDSPPSSLPPNICRVSLPAETLGFEELVVVAPPNETTLLPPRSQGDIPQWLLSSRRNRNPNSNADAAIYWLLGIRNTVGSLLPATRRLSKLPSKRALLAASGVFLEPKQNSKPRNQQQQHQHQQHQHQHQRQHNSHYKRTRKHTPKHNRLTVAAKARSKHAPRAITEASFFGIAKGPVPQQNREASRLVESLLTDCVWINCHVFGGLTTNHHNRNHNSESNSNSETRDRQSSSSSWVMELRQEQGYGARWLVEDCWLSLPNGDDGHPDSTNDDDEETRHRSVVTFRGFLEPQMEDGHERKWRH